MFFLTKDIKDGRPEKECIREIFEDVYSNSQVLLFGMGGLFFVFFFLQAGLIGGMPKTAQGSDNDLEFGHPVPKSILVNDSEEKIINPFKRALEQ
jgi:hypothetical protein